MIDYFLFLLFIFFFLFAGRGITITLNYFLENKYLIDEEKIFGIKLFYYFPIVGLFAIGNIAVIYNFINPINQSVVELIGDMGLKPAYTTFLSSVKTIFVDTVDLSDSEWSSNKYFYHSDPWHYRSSTGTLFLNQILSDKKITNSQSSQEM